MPEQTESHRRWNDLADDRFLTRREAELLIANTTAAEEERATAHLREHLREREALDKALNAATSQQGSHNISHDRAHEAHEEKHRSENKAVETALAALDRERKIHADAHVQEHVGHQREHGLNNLAIDKAEAATDKRFISVNGDRAQVDGMLRTMTSQDAFNALAAEFTRYREDRSKDLDRYREDSRKDLDRRFSEQQGLITAVREADIKAEGKGMGQTATIAAIIGSVTVASTVLGLIIVLSNLVTGNT